MGLIVQESSPPKKHEAAKDTLAQQNEAQLLAERRKVQNLESLSMVEHDMTE